MTTQRIGIITFWESRENYGQLAQASALQIFLESQGYEPFLILYNKSNSVNANKPGKLQSALNKDWNKLLEPQKVAKKIRTFVKKKAISPNRRFDEFRNDFLRCHHVRYESPEELMANPPEADIYITGSDQVWNHNYIGDPRPFFLQFGHKHIKRIAYAASFGHRKLPPGIFNLYKSYLNSFNAISVREKSGMDICMLMGYPLTELLPDPTLLIDKSTWMKYSHPSRYGSSEQTELKNVMAYTIGNRSSQVKDDILAYLKSQQDFDVTHVSINNDFTGNAYPTLPEWLDCYNKADFVVTNSYHGVLFSIIFNKNFIAIPCAGDKEGMNERLTTILEKFELSSHIVDRFDPQLINEVRLSNVDWKGVNKRIEDWRAEAIYFLKGLLVSAPDRVNSTNGHATYF